MLPAASVAAAPAATAKRILLRSMELQNNHRHPSEASHQTDSLGIPGPRHLQASRTPGCMAQFSQWPTCPGPSKDLEGPVLDTPVVHLKGGSCGLDTFG